MRSTAVSALHEPPFPARRHPDTDEVATQSLDWARRLGLVDDGPRWRRLRRAAAAELVGRACPQAPTDRLRLLADLVTWLFVMDDACDEDGLGAQPTRLAPTVGALLDVLDRLGDPGAPTPPDAGPLGMALHDVCRRVRDQGCPALLLRLVSQLREYLLALLWEAANREHRRVPDLAEYVQMRRHTGGARPSMTLTDLAYDGLPTARRRVDPEVFALDDLSADLVCWCNDLFSHRKERRVEADAQNLVTVIAAQHGLDSDAAFRAAADRFNDALAHYLDREATLAGDPSLAPFLAVRRAWIRATYDWSLRATRYD
ncbi:terpene synthase family protein [Micromonospora halophytica]|uniref:Terpene synthase n=1 Tax=Micromonospora halophytica TaxID=47864 RepID=A0A1C5GUL8_9ACTN|nr:terpene synthase [Micromonospora halophytica]SCG37423.1 Terpene synthase family, metal binding domain [Micromonospora halophytica]